MSSAIVAQEFCIDKFSGFQYSHKRSFVIDEIGRLLIATDGEGIISYDGYDLTMIDPNTIPASKIYNFIRDIERLPDGTIMSALEGVGTIIYGRDSSIVFTDHELSETGLYHDRIESYWSRNDTLIIGDRDGYLSFIDLNNFNVIKTISILERHQDIFKEDIPRAQVFDIETDLSDNCILWVLAGGLIRYNVCTDESQHFPQGKDFINDLGLFHDKKYTSYGMYEIEQYGDYVFASSWGGGLVYFDKRTHLWKQEHFEPYTDRYALDENVINYLIPINDTIILANGVRQGFFFDMKNLRKITTDEIINTSFNITDKSLEEGVVYNNKLYTADRDKFCVYRLDSSLHSQEDHTALPYIKSVFADGKSLDEGRSIYPVFNSFVPKEYRNINIDFRLPLPTNKDSVEYEYKMIGRNDDWKNIGQQHTLQFDNISGGDYEFHVRAREKGTNNEDWRYLEQALSLQIERYTTEKLWFRLLMAAGLFSFLLGIIYFFVRFQREKQALRIQHLKELQRVQLSALRARMNPHFLFNSLTSINNYVMHEEPRKASKYLTKFSHLMRKVLNNSERNLLPLHEEISTLRMYTDMENIRFGNRFDVQFEVDESINVLDTYIPTMILQPYIENAIHHGLNPRGEGEIRVCISLQETNLNISISDNGIGRAAAQKIKAQKQVKNKSMGMKITTDRINLIEEIHGIKTTVTVHDILDSSGVVAGTKVNLLLPLITTNNLSAYDSK